MKILVLTNWFPYPPDNGSKIRAFNLIKQLARRQHEVTLLSFSDGPVGEEHQAAMRPYCRQVQVLPRIHFQPHRMRAILSALSPLPRSTVDTFSREMQQALDSIVRQHNFDLLLATESGIAFYAKDVPGPRKIVDDLQVTPFRDRILRQRSWRGKLHYGPGWWKFKRLIRLLVDSFDGYTTTSKQERDFVQEVVPPARSKFNSVIPNGVDLEHYSGDFGPPKADTLIFSSTLTYHANFWAIRFFLEEIWPLIKKERPDVILRATGKTEGVALKDLPNQAGVIFTGYLDDIRPAIAQSWGSIVPLRIGGGTRLKILEAMALGVPVVSTFKGAQGLDVTHGQNILLADEPAEFAACVLRLLQDAELRKRLSEQGQHLVQAGYGWDAIGQRFDDFLQRVAARETVTL